MTHENTITQWSYYKEGRDPAVMAEREARQKQLDAAQRLVTSEKNRVDKAAAAKAKKDLEAQAETLLLSEMSTDEKTAYKKRKTQQKKDNANEKKEFKRRRIDAANDMLHEAERE
jgi:hypothetical protein